jgi:putative transposase
VRESLTITAKETALMKGKRYTEEQIIKILKEIEVGNTVAEVCRKYNVAEGTVYRWRNKYRGMDKSQLRRLKELEQENGRLKKIVAQQALDIDALKDLLGKEW